MLRHRNKERNDAPAGIGATSGIEHPKSVFPSVSNRRHSCHPSAVHPCTWQGVSRIDHLDLQPFADDFGVTQQRVDRRVFVGHVFQLGQRGTIHARSLVDVCQT